MLLKRIHCTPASEVGKVAKCKADPLIIKFEPLLARGADEGVVMAAMNSSAVHQNAVQPVLVAHRAVCFGREVLAVFNVQVELLRELISVIDLHQIQAGANIMPSLMNMPKCTDNAHSEDCEIEQLVSKTTSSELYISHNLGI